jgi:hypothetical protein
MRSSNVTPRVLLKKCTNRRACIIKGAQNMNESQTKVSVQNVNIVNFKEEPKTLKENDVVYPKIEPEPETPYSNLTERSLSSEVVVVGNKVTELINDIFIDILKQTSKYITQKLNAKDPETIINDEVILTPEAFIKIISVMTNVDEEFITISCSEDFDEEPGCCSFVTVVLNPNVREIYEIKVNGQDFNVVFNSQFNQLKNKYKISTDYIKLE